MNEDRCRVATLVLPLLIILSFVSFTQTANAQTLLWVYHTQDPVLFAPAVGTDGTAYFAVGDSHIDAVSASGTLLWGVDPGGLPSAGMALYNGFLYFPTSQGELVAYSVSGHLAWRLDLHSDIRTIPAVAGDGTLYVGTVDGRLVAITPAGQIKWQVDLVDPVIANPVVTHAGDIIVASYENLFEFDSSGKQVWYLPAYSHVTGRLALDASDNVYFTDGAGKVWSVSPEGAKNWTTTLTAAAASPVVSKNHVYIVTSDQNLHRLAATSGTEDWTLAKGSDGTPALSEGNILCLGSADDKVVYELNTSTKGTAGQTSPLPDAPGDTVLVQTTKGPRLYFTSGANDLFCFSTPGGPDITMPWNQLGAGPRHLFRRDDPPTVTMTSPTDGDSVSGTVAIVADVSDDFPQGLQVRFYAGDALIDSVNKPPFETSWVTSTVANGSYTLSAQVKDSAGQITTSQIQVTVNNSSDATTIYPDTPPPAFSWSSETEDHFRVEFSVDQGFDSLLTSSKSRAHSWLKGSNWQPSKRKWKKVLAAAAGVTDADTQVYWRVVGKSGALVSSGTFNIARPGAAAPSAPADGSQVAAGTAPIFRWGASHNDRYIVEFSATADFSGGVHVSSSKHGKKWLKQVTWTPGAKRWKKILQTGTTIYWRVRAKDAIGRETVSLPSSLEITS